MNLEIAGGQTYNTVPPLVPGVVASAFPHHVGTLLIVVCPPKPIGLTGRYHCNTV